MTIHISVYVVLTTVMVANALKEFWALPDNINCPAILDGNLLVTILRVTALCGIKFEEMS